MIRRFLFACAVAAVFTAALNARNILEWQAGRLTISELNDHVIDERLYFSIIAKTGQGNPLLGHTSYLEHRGDAAAMSLAPVIEGLPMRWFGLPLAETLLLGDVVFPFLATFFLTIGLLSFFAGSFIIPGATALLMMSDIGVYWLRASNPQLPFVGSAAWLMIAFLFPVESAAGLLLRGMTAGILFWLHPLYASFFIIADGTLLLMGLLRHRSWTTTLRSGLLYSAGILALLIPRFLLKSSPEATTDTLARAGMIQTHLPAAPETQIILMIAAIAFLFLWWKKKSWPSERLRLNFSLILAALIALNQSVIHGQDALFVAYYTVLIQMVLILTGVTFFFHLIRNSQSRRDVMIIAAAMSMLGFWNALGAFLPGIRTEAQLYEKSDAPAVLAWLHDQKGMLAIAAPNALNERIPYETPHYVLFNEYGWNQQMTDAELAERYALQVNLIPSSILKDKTYSAVFGGNAGLTSAKRRALCRIERTIFRTGDPCTLDARTLIRHQELLPLVDDAKIDVPAMMKKYHVSFVITEKDQTLPASAKKLCTNVKVIGDYTIWSCPLQQ